MQPPAASAHYCLSSTGPVQDAVIVRLLACSVSSQQPACKLSGASTPGPGVQEVLKRHVLSKGCGGGGGAYTGTNEKLG